MATGAPANALNSVERSLGSHRTGLGAHDIILRKAFHASHVMHRLWVEPGRVGDLQLREAIHTIECSVADVLDADRDRQQIDAGLFKSLSFNPTNLGRNSQIFEVRATIEHFLRDEPQGFWKVHMDQIAAALEGLAPDGVHSFWDHYRHETAAPFECTRSDGFHSVRNSD